MTEQIRYRIDRELVRKAQKVCRDIGMTPTQAVSVFFAQMVSSGGLPFRPTAYPALEEYGVTMEEAQKAFAAARNEMDKEFESGEMVEFKGKLP